MTLEARSDKGDGFGRDDLRDQFLICTQPDVSPAEWRVRRFGELQAAHHASLPLHPIVTAGETVGLFLGWPTLSGGPAPRSARAGLSE